MWADLLWSRSLWTLRTEQSGEAGGGWAVQGPRCEALDQRVMKSLRKLLRGKSWKHVCDDWGGGRVKCPGLFCGVVFSLQAK